ncbi:hypothetical protein [Rhizobium paknamense]|uniref:Uncharacterized protein n=1 Tax=Rhizobium paknamense TaxID=1206817 RepID=A0ABU0I8Q8_9HYPH|nr:hypothetical protein [Rhizobium paknamense]MDQ0454618.1 hypothetical protein [Rhizobium paknamense]
MGKRNNKLQKKAGSMAVWCISDGDVTKTSMETHFNFWRIAGDRDFKGRDNHPPRDFLEIGLLVTNPKPLRQICVYLPVKVEIDSIQDAGAQLDQTSVAQGIFNEKLQCATTPPPARIELKNSENLFCRVHKFIKQDDRLDPSHLFLEKLPEGTLLSIKKAAIESVSHEIKANERIYFRLRIYLPTGEANSFIQVLRPIDRNFQSGFEEIEYIDFRFNEIRTLPPQIENRIRSDEKDNKVKISLLAFLTALPVHSELAASSIQWHKNRLLEHDPWDNYVPSGIPGGMVVYHWKKEGGNGHGVTDFSSFVKLHTRRSGRKILVTYLAIAFFFGLLGNLAAAAVQEWL